MLKQVRPPSLTHLALHFVTEAVEVSNSRDDKKSEGVRETERVSRPWKMTVEVSKRSIE